MSNKRELTPEEIREYVDDGITTESHGNGKWVEYVTTVFQDEHGDYYSVDWNRGLTELQEDEFYEQPVQVHPVTKIRASKETAYHENPNANLSFSIDADNIEASRLIVENADKAIETLKEYDTEKVVDFLNQIEPIMLPYLDDAFLSASRDLFKALTDVKKQL